MKFLVKDVHSKSDFAFNRPDQCKYIIRFSFLASGDFARVFENKFQIMVIVQTTKHSVKSTGLAILVCGFKKATSFGSMNDVHRIAVF